MTENKNIKQVNKEVQISLVCDRVLDEDDSNEKENLKFRIKNKKIREEVNTNKFESHINLIEGDNFLLKSKCIKSANIHQSSKKNNDNAKNENEVLFKKTAPSASTKTSHESNTIGKQKHPKKIVLELRPEYSIKKNKTDKPKLQALNCDNHKLFPITQNKRIKPGKVVLELREEPCNQIIKTTTPTLAVQEANGNDSSLLPSIKTKQQISDKTLLELCHKHNNKMIKTTSTNPAQVQDTNSKLLQSKEISYNITVDIFCKNFGRINKICSTNPALLPSTDNSNNDLFQLCYDICHEYLDAIGNTNQIQVQETNDDNSRILPSRKSKQIISLESFLEHIKEIEETISIHQQLVTKTNDDDPKLLTSTKIPLQLFLEHIIKFIEAISVEQIKKTNHEDSRLLLSIQNKRKDPGDVALKSNQVPSNKMIKTTTSTLAVQEFNSNSSRLLPSIKNNRNVPDNILKTHEEPCNKMIESSAVQEVNDNGSRLLPSKKTKQIWSDKVVPELYQEPINKMIDTTFSNPSQIQEDFNDDFRLLPSAPYIKSEKTFEVDEVDDNHVFKSIITIENNSLFSCLPPKPSEEDPYICCGHSFCSPIEVKFHVEWHRKKKFRPHNTRRRLLNNSVNLTTPKKCKTPVKSNLNDTQTLPVPDSINLTDVNKSFDKVNKSVPSEVLTFYASEPVDIIVKKIFEKQTQDKIQKLQSTSNTISLTADDKCDKQNKFNQCNSEPYPDTIDLTADEKCNEPVNFDQEYNLVDLTTDENLTATNSNDYFLNKTDHCVTKQLPVSGSISIFVNDANCYQLKESNRCNTQDLIVTVTSNLIPNECGKKKESLQHDSPQLASDTIDLTCDENLNEENKTDRCNTKQLSISCAKDLRVNEYNKQNIILHQNTQPVKFSHAIEDVANNQKLDQQITSNHHDIQQLSLNQEQNKRNGQKKSLPHDDQQLAFAKNMSLSYNKKHNEQNKANKYNIQQLEASDTIEDVADEQHAYNSFNSCEFSAENRLLLKFCKATKEKKKLYKCHICSQSFFAYTDFMDHIMLHDKKKEYSCRLCKQTFSVKSKLTNHLKTHSIKKHFECEVCKKYFTKKSDYMYHVQIHTGYKPFKCTKCKMSFKRKSLYLFHKRSHVTTISNDCYLCLKTFIHESSLKRHLIMHSKEISFQCNTCKMHFNKKSKLISHVRNHAGAVTEPCTSGNSNQMSFETLSKQSNQLNTCNDNTKCQRKVYKHTEEIPHQCRACKIVFKNFSSLLMHLKKKH